MTFPERFQTFLGTFGGYRIKNHNACVKCLFFLIPVMNKSTPFPLVLSWNWFLWCPHVLSTVFVPSKGKAAAFGAYKWRITRKSIYL